jgi:hypothetical protein
MTTMSMITRVLSLLIPSWRFFENPDDKCILWVKVDDKWRLGLQEPNRHFWNLFLNVEANLYLARQSAVDRLVVDLSKKTNWPTRELEQLPSFQFVHQIAQSTSAHKALDKSIHWKLCVEQDEILRFPFLKVP